MRRARVVTRGQPNVTQPVKRTKNTLTLTERIRRKTADMRLLITSGIISVVLKESIRSEITSFLRGYQRARARIVFLQTELGELQDLCERITVDPTKEKIQSSGSKDRLGDTVARIADKETEIMSEVAHAFDTLNEIESALSKIDDPEEQLVLQIRYIEGRDWEYTARKMNVNKRTAQRLNDRAKMSLFVVLKSGIMQGVKE